MKSGTRLRTIKQKRVCLLCFSSEHFANNCNAPPCSICSFRHNELLCFKRDSATKKENSRKQISAPPTSSDKNMSSQPVASLHISSSPEGSVVLLATAKIFAFDINGVKRPVRALIDCASQGTFVTEACVRKLGCKPERAHSRIFGFGQADAGRASGLVRFQIQSMSERANFNIEALVVDRIAQCPKLSVDKISWPHVRGLLLADSEFFSDYPIDILLGSEWFAKLVIGVPIQGPEGTPDVIPTVFGHCLLGKIHDLGSQIQSLCSTVDSDIRDIVKRFWEVEEPPQTSTFTPEDKACESHFNLTVSKVGHRYVVRLPFREHDIDIGDSFSLARRRFHSLEKRLDKSRILRSKYNEFMQDLLDQGHMVKANEPPKGLSYYVPHHCIFRPGDEMSRFRVVFDCFMKTDNGVSLNQVLHVGPKLQMDIIDILVRFRIHDIVFTTDIRQMYRNIRVHENDLDFQRIFWRFDSKHLLINTN
uniref:Actin cytoskeleton-regulatory complex protein SLA1 n=1 Tax=Lygus hesperus TaxID=30085 RepID=A0A0A9XSN0_LYGHE